MHDNLSLISVITEVISLFELQFCTEFYTTRFHAC